MHLVAIQHNLLVHVADLTVYPDPHIARFADVLKDFAVLAFAILDEGSHDHDAAALGQRQDGVNDLLYCLLADLPATLGAVGNAYAGVEQAQVVVDFGHRAHRGAGVAAGSLLVNADGWREALDVIHVGLVHLAQELAGVGRKGLDITALTFGVNGVKGQARLARARDAGDDHQLVAGDFHVNVFQVVFPCATDNDFVLWHKLIHLR